MLLLPSAVGLDLVDENCAVPAAGEVACLPLHVQAAGELRPGGVLTTAPLPGGRAFSCLV